MNLFKKLLFGLTLLSLLCLFNACEKKEHPVSLIQNNDSVTHDQLNMGENYDNQFFYNFALGKTVFSSKINSWDLAFENSPIGRHVFLNGGNNIQIIKTNYDEIRDFTAVPSNIKEFKIDASSGNLDSTAIGEWEDKSGKGNKVYLLKKDTAYYKLKIKSANPNSFNFEWAKLIDTAIHKETIKKETEFNYSYFSFNLGSTHPAPKKEDWDVVFTRYATVLFDAKSKINLNYIVTGVLINNLYITACTDSVTDFNNITKENCDHYIFKNNQDVIGYDWKTYGLGTTGHYDVNPHKNYIIHDAQGSYWKLHFLDFYSTNGVKGSPLFEYKKIN